MNITANEFVDPEIIDVKLHIIVASEIKTLLLNFLINRPISIPETAYEILKAGPDKRP
jgi:hypothetical protein